MGSRKERKLIDNTISFLVTRKGEPSWVVEASRGRDSAFLQYTSGQKRRDGLICVGLIY